MRRLSGAVMYLATVLLSTTNSHAYVLPVIDAANLIPNTTTATATTLSADQLILQVLNSDQEVAMMRQNLIPGGGGVWDDLLGFFKRLDGSLGQGQSLHYLLANLNQLMSARYPGYINPGKNWLPAYEMAMQTNLSTLRGTLLSVREQLKPAERLREEAIIYDLRENNLRANGNLAVQQAGNAITLALIEEFRKHRQMTGAGMNAQNIALSQQGSLQAAGDKVFADWIEKSQIPVTAYSGSGGFGPGSFAMRRVSNDAR